MLRAEKEQVVEELSSRLGEARCLYLTDFTGLDVEAITDLRRKLRAAEVEYVVVKNTLARRALAGSQYEELTDHLDGPSAFALSNVDVVSAAKILTDFAKGTEKPSIRAGAIEGQVISIDEIRRLASLPPREQLLAKMVGQVQAPITGLVYTLHALLSKLVRTLDAVWAKREAAEETAPEPVAEEEPQPAEPEEKADEAESGDEEAIESAPTEDAEAEEVVASDDVEAEEVEPEAEPAEDGGESGELEEDQPETEASVEEPEAGAENEEESEETDED